jgi:hypothetical protein
MDTSALAYLLYNIAAVQVFCLELDLQTSGWDF